MQKRRLILLLLACGLLAGVLVFVFTGPREPSYKGRNLSAWVRLYSEAHRANRVLEEQEAVEALRHIGTNAVPFFLARLQAKPTPRWKVNLEQALEKLFASSDSRWPYLSGRRSRDEIRAFAVLGPAAAAAVPELTRLANDTNHTFLAGNAMIALGFVGKDGLLPLIALMSHETEELRFAAVYALSLQGTNALAAVPALLHCLTDSSPYVRKEATNALLGIAPKILQKAPPK